MRDLVQKIFGEADIRLGWEAWPDPEVWFALARTAKELFPHRFSPKERKFIYHMGIYTANKREPSEAQRRWAGSIMAEALACKASEGLDGTVEKLTLEKYGGPFLCALDEVESVLEAGERTKDRFVCLLERTANGKLPLRMLIAVTPEARAALQEGGITEMNGVEVVQVPALTLEEAAQLAESVLHVYEAATGQSSRIAPGIVRELVRRSPNRRAFVQNLVRYLETAGG